MICSGSCIMPLQFSCSSGSKVYTWNFQLAPVSVPLLGADFLEHFNLLVDIKGPKVVHADYPEDIVICASSGPQPTFKLVSFLSTPQQVKKLLEEFPDVLSSDGFTASKPGHGVRHHLLINLEKTVEPAIIDVKSALLGKGYLSGMVTLFNLL